MFDQEILVPGVHRYHNVLQGLDIVSHIEDYASSVKTTWEKTNNKLVDGPWQISFAATDKVVDKDALPINELLVPITERLHEYSNLYKTSFSPDESSHWQCLKYDSGNTFNRHHDDHGSFKSRISLVYYVNDDYEGGGLEFHNFGKVVEPISDSLLVFPSSYLFAHTAQTIISGTKYSITRFLP